MTNYHVHILVIFHNQSSHPPNNKSLLQHEAAVLELIYANAAFRVIAQQQQSSTWSLLGLGLPHSHRLPSDWEIESGYQRRSSNRQDVEWLPCVWLMVRLKPLDVSPRGDSGGCVSFWEIAAVTFTNGVPVFGGFLFCLAVNRAVRVRSDARHKSLWDKQMLLFCMQI